MGFIEKYEALLGKIRTQQLDVNRWVASSTLVASTHTLDQLKTLSIEERTHFDVLGQMLQDLKGPVARMESQVSKLDHLTNSFGHTACK